MQLPIPSRSMRIMSLLYAAILTIMVTAQLFRFHEFIPLIESFWLPGHQSASMIIASLIVSLELLALPFLVRMPLSLLMQLLSMLCGLVIAFVWLIISIYLASTINAVTNAGFFGVGLIDFPTGWPSVIFSAFLCVLALWSMWGILRSDALRPARLSNKND